MQDQNQSTQNSNSSQDDFYNDVSSLNVSENEFKVMAAITQAQMDSAEKAGEMVDEMKEIVKQEDSE